MFDFHKISQYFSFIFCVSICLQRSDLCLLIQNFFSPFEILNPDNKPTIFCELFALFAWNSMFQVCLQGCDVPLCQLLMALWMPLIFSSWAQRKHGFRFGVAWSWKIRFYMGEGRVSVMRTTSLPVIQSSIVSASTFEHTEKDPVKVTTENTTEHFSAQTQHLELHQETN